MTQKKDPEDPTQEGSIGGNPSVVLGGSDKEEIGEIHSLYQDLFLTDIKK